MNNNGSAPILKRKRQLIDTSSSWFFSVRILQATCAQLQQKERLEQELSVSKDDSLVIPATSYVYVLGRLNILSNEDFDGLELRWHKTCYSNFSSESKLQRLKCY